MDKIIELGFHVGDIVAFQIGKENLGELDHGGFLGENILPVPYSLLFKQGVLKDLWTNLAPDLMVFGSGFGKSPITKMIILTGF